VSTPEVTISQVTLTTERLIGHAEEQSIFAALGVGVPAQKLLVEVSY
jgi:hypothetical protein